MWVQLEPRSGPFIQRCGAGCAPLTFDDLGGVRVVYRWRARCQLMFSFRAAGRHGLASHSPSSSSARLSWSSRSVISAERAARWQLVSPSHAVSASERKTRSQVVGGASSWNSNTSLTTVAIRCLQLWTSIV